MTNIDAENLAFAIKDAEYAFRLLEFSIRVMNYIDLDQVDLNTFGQETTILLDEENVTFDDGYFSSRDNAVLVSQMAVGAAFGASAIALDNVIEATGRNRNPDSTAEIDQLWAVIYAVRNAFAHGIAKPIWVIKEKYRREIELTLDGKTVMIDFSNLDGQSFEYAHLSGFGNWLRIKDRVFELVQQQ